jgi:hypothetical protein
MSMNGPPTPPAEDTAPNAESSAATATTSALVNPAAFENAALQPTLPAPIAVDAVSSPYRTHLADIAAATTKFDYQQVVYLAESADLNVRNYSNLNVLSNQ